MAAAHWRANLCLIVLLRPRILLPSDLAKALDARELRLVLLHELAHVRRPDVGVNWLVSLLQMLRWSNPVLRTARGDERRTYGQVILKLVESVSRRGVVPGTVGILEGSRLTRRITMIARFNSARTRFSSLAALLIVPLAIVAMTDAVGSQPAGMMGRGPVMQPVRGGFVRTTVAPTDARAEQANARTREMLRNTIVPEINLVDVSLNDAIEFVQGVTKANFFVDWQQVEAVGATADTVVTLRLKNVSMEDVLRLMLRRAGNQIDYELELRAAGRAGDHQVVRCVGPAAGEAGG